MKKCTSLDVAKRAGVSQSTVSFVLNNRKDISISQETRERVLKAAEELHYIPGMLGKGMKTGGERVIGVLIPNISNPFYPMLAQSLQIHAQAAGYSLLICNISRNVQSEKHSIQLLLEKGVDALLFGFTPYDDALVNAVASTIPVVIIGEADERHKVHIIGLNSFHSGDILTEHLVKLGHRKIAFVSTPFENVSLSRHKRFQGVREYLEKHGLEKGLCLKVAANEYEAADGAFEVETGYLMTQELLKEQPVTAIIGVNDMVALGAMRALSEAGLRIPQDVSVGGFDNLYLSQIAAPKLTTVDHYISQRGRTAIQTLVNMLEHNEQSLFKVEYEPSLVIRESTGPAKG